MYQRWARVSHHCLVPLKRLEMYLRKLLKRHDMLWPSGFFSGHHESLVWHQLSLRSFRGRAQNQVTDGRATRSSLVFESSMKIMAVHIQMVGNDYLEHKKPSDRWNLKKHYIEIRDFVDTWLSHNEIIFLGGASKQVSALNSIDYFAQDQSLQRLFAEHMSMWLYLAKP